MKQRVFCLLMALLMCLPFAVANAATKTSADFSDLKDLDAATKAKFDAMISAGIFDGVSEGSFGLKDEMNRAQFAKVAALIFNLEVDTDLKTSSFKDVKADDPANGYALPYIEAVKKAGITEGYGEGSFNPAGTVTKEQLATFLVRGLGMKEDAKATPGVNDDTVSDWAKSYVALALDKKIMSNGADGTFGGTTNATRDLLVTGSYEAKEQYVEIEQKKKEEEEKKKKEEEEKKKEESTPPPVYSPPYVPPIVETPTANPAGGMVLVGTSVTLSTYTSGAEIHYTLDGSTPTASSPIYSGSLSILENVTVKAIAIMSGYSNSAVMTESYTVTAPPETVATPTANPAGGEVEEGTEIILSTETDGAVIHYTTDGSTPTTDSDIFNSSSPIVIIQNNTTIKAIAIKPGAIDSDVMTETYSLEPERAETPVASVASGEVSVGQAVYLSTTTLGATIRYTTNGLTPSESGADGFTNDYSEPIQIDEPVTIKAIAVMDGMAASEVMTVSYTIAAGPEPLVLHVDQLSYMGGKLIIAFREGVDSATVAGGHYELSSGASSPSSITASMVEFSSYEVELDVGDWIEGLSMEDTVELTVSGVTGPLGETITGYSGQISVEVSTLLMVP